MVYWTLIPHNFSNTIGSVNIRIYSNFKYSNSLNVWGYGDYGALTYVDDGFIEMESNGKLKSNEYMTILVKFPLGSFKTTNKLYHNFDYYFKMAEENSVKYNNSQKSNLLILILIVIIPLLTIIFVLIVYLFAARIFEKISRKLKPFEKNFSYGESGKHISTYVDYYRDLPCNNNIFEAYYISRLYKISDNDSNILGAIILKWIKDDFIQVKKDSKTNKFSLILTTNKSINYFHKTNVFDLDYTDPSINNTFETKLFFMLKEASIDGILEENEFKKWCKNSYSTLLSWFNDISYKEKLKLCENKLIRNNNNKYVATSELKEKALNIAGFKRYLLDYTLIHSREAIEVKLFEEYLVYAQMLGIAKKVSKQFKDLYPELIEQSNFNTFDSIVFINYCSNIGIKSARNAKSAAKARASMYSSGGGGYSSGGGGGGSFGGSGSGGGGFR